MEVVTCLHGFSQHGDSWQEVAALVDGERRWLTPDLSATSLEGAVDEVVELWDREGISQSHLVGYSQGGRVALNLACRRPERLLTLTAISAHAGLDGAERSVRLRDDLALADRIEKQGVDWFARHWAEQPLFRGLARRGPEFLAGLDSSRRRNDAGQLAAILRGLGAGATMPFWDWLDAIHAPTLLVAGAEDERYAAFAERLHSAISGSRLAIVADAGHVVHLEQPGATARLLRDHLSTR